MPEFMEVGRVDLITERLGIALRFLPEILEEENDLRGEGGSRTFLEGEFRPHKQTERVGFDPIAAKGGAGTTFHRHSQSASLLPQRRRERGQGRFDFVERKALKTAPIVFQSELF